MPYWLLTHEHRFGQSAIIIASETAPPWSTIEAYAKRALDYEPEEDEFLTLVGIEIVTLDELSGDMKG